MKKALAIMALGLLLVGMSCSGPADVEGPTSEDPDFAGPVHSAREIREKVDAILIQRRVQAEKYDVTAFTYDYVDKQWAVYFLGRDADLDSHFTIRLKDDNLDDFEVVPGL
jgi:hypothetical protein